MFKRFIVGFVIFTFVMVPTQVQAQELEGQVTSLAFNEKAPYSGVLLDPIAASKMIINQKYLRAEIELELRKEFQEELSGKRLSHDLLKVDYDSLKKIYEETLSLKKRADCGFKPPSRSRDGEQQSGVVDIRRSIDRGCAVSGCISYQC